MRRIVLFLLAAALAAIPALAQTPRKTTLAVMDLSATGISKSDGEILTNALLSYLVNTNYYEIVERSKRDNTNYYEIVERSKRDEILKEQGFAQSGACNETACLIEVGQYLSVQKMVGGSVGKFGQTWTVNIRLLDVKTGKVEKACIKNYRGEMDQLLTYMNDIAQEIVQATGPTKEQLEAMQQKEIADSIAAAQAEAKARQQVEQQRLAQEKAIQDSLAKVELGRWSANVEARRKAQVEYRRKQFVADSLDREVRRTKLKLPTLTYVSLGGTALLAGITYLYYTGANDSYNKYLAATTSDDATKYRDETDSKNKTAAICSYAAIGVGAVNLVSWFLRTKAHPELTKQTAIELTPALSYKRGSEGEFVMAYTWRF
ncbi:hypothetical protein HY768_01945 [candidate division TA06 bacterium]|uniref:DUF5683 domain-containing protein n=1 Tax=candidate division TA06 bacterium TaxID=2250710 RepID=A0A933I7L1_UNCT6|nr:hypothetical protein [candidate division TA06 bacterium]